MSVLVGAFLLLVGGGAGWWARDWLQECREYRAWRDRERRFTQLPRPVVDRLLGQWRPR